MSNFIQNIEISNFKSIRHQKIEGCKRINVFIGYPNVGKSNILEALSLLCIINDTNDFPTFEQLCNSRELSDMFFDGNIQNDIVVNYSLTRNIRLNYSTGRLILNEVALSDKSIVLWGPMHEHFFKEKINTAITRKVIFKDNDRGRNIGDTNIVKKDSLKWEIKKYEFVKNIDFSKTNQSTSLEYPSGGNLYSIIANNSVLRKVLVPILAEYGLKLLFEKGNKYEMKVMKTLSDDTVFNIPFNQIADTLQRLIFYKAAMQTNKDTVLIFEEPESHMFPPYVRRFANDIALDENNNQYFIATHSPYVLDALMEEASEDLSVYLVDYKNGETNIRRMEEDDIDEIRSFGVDLFFNIESYLNSGNK